MNKEKLLDIFENLTNVEPKVWATIIGNVLVLINSVIVMAGGNGFAVTDSLVGNIYLVLSALAIVIMFVVDFWYNHSFTGKHQMADKITQNYDTLKELGFGDFEDTDSLRAAISLGIEITNKKKINGKDVTKLNDCFNRIEAWIMKHPDEYDKIKDSLDDVKHKIFDKIPERGVTK